MYNNDYRPYGGNYPDAAALASTVSSTMKRVYLKMFLAMLVTAVTSWLAATSQAYMTFLFTHTWMMFVLIAAEFGLVIAISGAINRLSSSTASLLFYLFAVVNGLTLCTIFYAIVLPPS